MEPLPVFPIITLTTDFGLEDHYVGTMKGVLLTFCPNAKLVDISHNLLPFSIHAGAYTIDQTSRYFPAGTVHLVVIDPGVGTSRRALLLEAVGQYFIAPDNGVLSLVLARAPSAKVREITNEILFLKPISATFHGRDVFAPAAGALANRTIQPDAVGPVLENIELLRLEPEQIEPQVWRGIVLSIDRFGNVITNFPTTLFPALDHCAFTIIAGGHKVTQFRRTFGEAPPGLTFAYFGSSGYVELGINQQSTAGALGLSIGDPVVLRV